ncbi:N-acetyl-gamma-glutamyl-phosphate reductase [Campylobacter sp. MIT 21-1685]|uniref:N-acetyl-gamma-glutamyl-phosphate reductase n=1 Tax=unclassified Campylobacter TaxID=2593542 RepID=UPI00224B30F8|nr:MULTISPECIES: N-acetyl-gamma-glutamyl-phosphate reductase [unclassified Campylobacter]MCX2683405.1 N-acetyl-gamma-glutamyl-phosphate reductase [Campylobacter sp. MIT 21-1684]MCX2751668.1 N-acetyl-gamma-glutamyl-phosphate reductase [Campylobacter sp. MIT 21-1682]MCX2807869.1 N-acetyl-gamma-glutamyl-phosphate reductase [Campylobacter sp. MIT 21-1685]
MRLKVGVLGASGYVGNELVRILLLHSKVQITFVASQNHTGKHYTSLYPHTPLNLHFENEDLENLSKKIDVLFTATPHNFTASLLNENILKNMKIIDLSADFRLKNPKNYETYYSFTHRNLKLLNKAVYGLCELYKAEIEKADLIANPGCYTTASILSLYPLLQEGVVDTNSLIIDAKSGVSGAGKNAKTENLFCEVNENLKAYALTSHRHTPEIEEHLSYGAKEKITLQFTPHLIPMQRGILTTSYANLLTELSEKELRKLYQKYYKKCQFIRLLDSVLPQTRFVRGTNYTDIHLSVDQRTKRVIVIAALDNLIKGAAGQAVQNMNIMFGFKESQGLTNLAMC